MAVTLNRPAHEYAEKLVDKGRVVYDENEFVRVHGFAEYGRWHLGVDDGYAEDTKARYRFPYEDFQDVHRCAILSAESRAGQYEHDDIERAAVHLHGMIEAVPH